jgi:putative hydrolase of the HAD superfamily
MIKNVVFDFGQVMVHFEPTYMVEKYVRDKADAELLERVVFDRLYWDRLDRGDISDGEVLSACRQRLPERLHAVAEQIYYSWIYNIPEIKGMRELALRLRDERGMRLFLLSNISTYFAEHAHEIDVLSIFERCIFSAVVGHVKPDRDMFEYLCDTCGILPEETVFVDDNAANIRGAEAFCIRGYLFDGDVDRLTEFFEKE